MKKFRYAGFRLVVVCSILISLLASMQDVAALERRTPVYAPSFLAGTLGELKSAALGEESAKLQPAIAVTPLSGYDEDLYWEQVVTRTLSVQNTGTQPLHFEISESAGVGTLANQPAGAPLTLSGGDTWLPFGVDGAPRAADLQLLQADSSVIELHADLSGSLVETLEVAGLEYSRLYGEGYGHAARVGLPDLPVLRREVEVPFGAVVGYEIVAMDYTDYSLAELGLSTLYPRQVPVSKYPGAFDNAPFDMDQDFYVHGEIYPQSPVALGENFGLRGHQIQSIEVWPVAYDPAFGSVRLYHSLTFRLKLSGGDMAKTQSLVERYASATFDARLADKILNYSQSSSHLSADKLTEGYLIITADAYYNAMLPFVALKQSQGFAVTMVRTSQISGGPTNTAIKAYVQNAYDTWSTPPAYLLLVGDTNTIPGWDSVSAGEITDLYYACMDGSSDWHPDLERGRFPVRSAAQTTAMVNKYLAYANLTGNESWLKRAAFIATCDEWAIAEGSHNEVIGDHMTAGGYTGSFPNNPQAGGDRLYCITHSAYDSDIQAALTQGRWIAIYSGHGGHTGWEMDYDNDDVIALNNGAMYPFVASHACVSGDFAVEQVYGETWVLQDGSGALAYWGSSDNSQWGPDDVLEPAAFDELFSGSSGSVSVGRMTAAGLTAVESSYPSYARYYWETYNILGDPALNLLNPGSGNQTVEIPWLHQSPVSGTVAAGETMDVVVSFDATAVDAVGTYRAYLNVASDDLTQSMVKVPVTMNVLPQAFLHGSVFDARSTASLSATVEVSQGASPVVTITSEPLSGTYSTLLDFGDYQVAVSASGYDTQTVDFALGTTGSLLDFAMVPLSPWMEIQPVALQETVKLSYTLDSTVVVYNNGSEMLDFTVCETISAGGVCADVPWMSISSAGTSVQPYSAFSVTVNLDGNLVGGQPGDYAAYLHFEGNDPELSELDLPVDLAVLPWSPELEIQKTASTDLVSAGGLLTYTLTVSNTGELAAHSVIVSDTLPANVVFVQANEGGALVADQVQWSDFDLAVDESKVFHFVVRLNFNLPHGSLIRNADYAISCAEGQRVAGVSVETTVHSKPNLEAVVTSHPDVVRVGDLLTYSFVLTNSGGADVHSAIITNPLPEHVSFVSADAGGMLLGGSVRWVGKNIPAQSVLTLQSVVLVEPTLPAGASLYNPGVRVTSDGLDVSGDPLSVVVQTAAVSPSLTLTAHPGVLQVDAGALLTYTLVVTNSGDGAATGMTITNVLPQHTSFVTVSNAGQHTGDMLVWSDLTLPASQSTTVYFVVRVATTVPSGTLILNGAYGVACAEGESAVGVAPAGVAVRALAADWFVFMPQVLRGGSTR